MAERSLEHPKRTPAVPAAPAVRYDISEVLASGGMGIVYLGFDRLAQRPIAYKRMKVSSESSRSRMAALFTREYDTLVHLAHPNIVEVLDFGLDAFGPYYTMELLSGDDLTNVAPLPVNEACRILRDVASALALLHARGLVHRDVSPNNVRLTSDGRAKLIDFGGLTKFGSPPEVIGTPAFIAPECLSDAALDGRTDLYALGALAYWTLTRRTHVFAHTLESLVDAWIATEVLPPSRYAPEVPKELDDLVLALLQHEPFARPTSAAYVIERLTSIATLAPEQKEAEVAYSYLQHAPLRGREEPMADLLHALESATKGMGGVVLVESEKGLGRTSLLDQLAVEAQLTGATVVRAQGSLHNTPFSAAHSLAEAGMGIFPDVAHRNRELSSRISPASVFGAARFIARSTIDISEQQARVAAFLHDSLLQLSLRNPLIMLVDDAHTIDGESLALFASMVEEVRGHPILLVLSVQANEPSRQPQAYTKLATSAKRVTLAPLSARQTAELVASMFGGVPNSQRLSDWLHEQTGGNPAHSMDLTHLLLAQGLIRYTIGTFTLPKTFGEVSSNAQHGNELRATLVDFSPVAIKLACLLAAHSAPLTITQLASASDLSTPEVLQATAALAHRGVVGSSGDKLSCASENVRAALLSGCTEAELRDTHLALARTFSGYDEQILENRLAVAGHLLSAGGEDAYEGACLLASTEDQHKFALAMAPPSLVLLERALHLLEQRGHSDQDCVGLIVPLAVAGFYGQLHLHERYFDRSMKVLSKLCGVTAALRVGRFVGPKLGLMLGILFGLLSYGMRRSNLNRRTFMQALESLGTLPSAANAATACVWDVPSSYRIAVWLDPFAHASERSSMALLRTFCIANADLVNVKLSVAAACYAKLFAIFQKPVFGLDDMHAEQFRCGCLHGQAQAVVTECAPESLTLADQLEARSTFFAPHAEGIRMTYYLFRGEAEQATVHRERAESLAFRAGTSWSAIGLLTLRSIQAHIVTGDVISLVHVMADLERLAKGLPHLEAMYELTTGHLELLRGHPDRAIAIYERVFAGEHAAHLPTSSVERTLHAQALSALGDFAAAKALCLQILDEIAASGRDGEHIFLSVREQLALAEAGLGNHEQALALIDVCFERARRYASPLSLGTVHRVRAYLAALVGDAASFEEHFAAMSELFRSTKNPWLLQQCDALRTQAVRLGVAAAAAGTPREQQDLDGATAMESKHPRAPEASAIVTNRRSKPASSAG